MRKTQVFKAKGGQMETLHKGFLDLRSLGPIEMRRSSEIEFDVSEQKFYIRFLEPELEMFNDNHRKIFFDTYEQAVEQEVREINTARKMGIL